MNNKMSHSLLLLLLVSTSLLSLCSGKTVYRRTDKISENFKQLDLPPEEIDPDVAPPEPQKLQNNDATAAVATPAEPSIIENIPDESANEIASVDAATAASPATAAAVETAKPKPKPKPTTIKPQTADADKNPISRYCKCSGSHCDCCRKFGLPLLPSGPGCAKISYLGNDEMSVSLKFGDITLASRRISSKRARPLCVGMPGGYSKFCGRVYGLSQAKENFKACLAFELRSEDELEAQLPISCFKFGAEGLRVAEPEPLPTKVKKPVEDDDDDIFGFGAGGDDDDEEDEDDYDDGDDDGDGEAVAEAEDDDTDDYAEDDDTEAPEDADYGGFSLGGLLDELEDDDDEKVPVKKPATGVTVVAATPVADQTTREHVEVVDTDVVQSKDDAGSAAASPAPDAATTVAESESAMTAAPSSVEGSTTATKGKKSKKAKKNKKKKKAATDATGDGEGDFAYELLNGILEFFN